MFGIAGEDHIESSYRCHVEEGWCDLRSYQKSGHSYDGCVRELGELQIV